MVLLVFPLSVFQFLLLPVPRQRAILSPEYMPDEFRPKSAVSDVRHLFLLASNQVLDDDVSGGVVTPLLLGKSQYTRLLTVEQLLGIPLAALATSALTWLLLQ